MHHVPVMAALMRGIWVVQWADISKIIDLSADHADFGRLMR
jgi:hypothetical protein